MATPSRLAARRDALIEPFTLPPHLRTPLLQRPPLLSPISDDKFTAIPISPKLLAFKPLPDLPPSTSRSRRSWALTFLFATIFVTGAIGQLYTRRLNGSWESTIARWRESFGAEMDGNLTALVEASNKILMIEDFLSTPSPATPQTIVVQTNPTPQLLLPPSSSAPRYLAYETHSGFHNQRISLTNALVLAAMLNRTLLLPPARLGRPEAWGPDLQHRLSRDERCKQEHGTSEACAIKDEWTYISWRAVLPENVWEGAQVVDRWNSSDAWFYDSESGLGVKEGGVKRFEDNDRRSIKFFDDKNTKGTLGKFTSRLDVEDLKEDASEVLHFGSLFSSARLVLRKEEDRRRRMRIEKRMVFRLDVVDKISEKARQRLGDKYVSVHLRVGDGAFKLHAAQYMEEVFMSLTSLLSMSPIEAKLLLPSFLHPSPRRHPKSHQRSARSPSRFTIARKENRPPTPLAPPALKCANPLYTTPSLLPLNTPLYIATDSRHPRTDPTLSLFFEHFPCAFTLADFENGLDGEESWVSDWDGLKMKDFLIPFLDAEIAAKGRLMVGTPGSTFSAYTAGVLHSSFQRERAREQGRKKKLELGSA